MLDALPYWLHLLAAAAWIGPQLMMFIAVVPALRVLDASARYRVLVALTPRFGWLGSLALLVLILTGIDNIDSYAPNAMFDLRYGYILTTKLVLVAVVAVLSIFHTGLVGPRLLRLQEQALQGGEGEAAELVRLRRQSIVLSVLTLLLSLAVLFCAALLRGVFAQHVV